MTKNYIQIIVSYESSGGHGDADAQEEGLRGWIDTCHEKIAELRGKEDGCTAEDYTQYTVESLQGLSDEEAKKLFDEEKIDGTNCHGDDDECERCISKCPDQREKEKK
jgi:hypothetical protein